MISLDMETLIRMLPEFEHRAKSETIRRYETGHFEHKNALYLGK